MKIAFISENTFVGEVPRDFNNSRVEFAWMIALKAKHLNIFSLENYTNESFDIGIVILPKKQIKKLNTDSNFLKKLRNICSKVAVMQEGPSTYFNDYMLEQQIWFYNMLCDVDFLLCHNDSDYQYYKGMTNKNVYVMPSLMIEDTIQNLKTIERKNIIVGGNLCEWYGGFQSLITANEIVDDDCSVYAPSMGRKIDKEEQLLNILPYMNWTDWIHKLNEFKFAIHLMPTIAAGTFALNCAALGIPCIGYNLLDTQKICHPKLSVDLRDINKARYLINKLKKEEGFYSDCSFEAKTNYNKYFSESEYLIKMNKIFKNEIIK